MSIPDSCLWPKPRRGHERQRDIACFPLTSMCGFGLQLKIADLVAENHRQMERLQSQSDTSSRASRSLELRVQSLEHDLELSQLEHSNTVSEYEGYKVRWSLSSQSFVSFTISCFIAPCTMLLFPCKFIRVFISLNRLSINFVFLIIG